MMEIKLSTWLLSGYFKTPIAVYTVYADKLELGYILIDHTGRVIARCPNNDGERVFEKKYNATKHTPYDIGTSEARDAIIIWAKINYPDLDWNDYYIP